MQSSAHQTQRCRPHSVRVRVRVQVRPAWRLAASMLLAIAGPSGAQADAPQTAAPGLVVAGHDGLREDIEWLVDRGVLDLPLSTWPMPLALLQPALWSARQRAGAGPDADALGRVERSLWRQRAGASALLRLNTARHPSLDAGARARGSAEAALVLHAESARWAAQLQFNSIAEPIGHSGRNVLLAGSYVALSLPTAQLTLGEVDRWWGPGRYSSSILSNAAPPFPALILARTLDAAPPHRWLSWIGPWGYELSLGQMRDYRPADTKLIGLRLYARPWRGWEIGAVRHIEWGGAGRPDDPRALWDALLARTNVEDAMRHTDPSNELAGVDLRISGRANAGWVWVGHAQLIGEDEAGKLPSRRIATVGAQLKHPWRTGRLEWSIEGSDTMLSRELGLGLERGSPQPAYRHGAYIDGYYHDGLPIGAGIGGGGRLYTLGLGWVPACAAECRRVRLAVFDARLSERGPEPLNAAFGKQGALRGLNFEVAAATATFDWSLGLSVQRYPAGPRPSVGILASVRRPLGAGPASR